MNGEDDLRLRFADLIRDPRNKCGADIANQSLNGGSATTAGGVGPGHRTANAVRKDGHHPIIYMQCGAIRLFAQSKKAIEDSGFEHVVSRRLTEFRPSSDREVRRAAAQESFCSSTIPYGQKSHRSEGQTAMMVPSHAEHAMGTVVGIRYRHGDQRLLLQNEYLAGENRILWAHLETGSAFRFRAIYLAAIAGTGTVALCSTFVRS